jgi:aerobic C4-dicarboxylate transport protein
VKPVLAKIQLDCAKHAVVVIAPTGYSFNLDGANIYMTLVTLFIDQAVA